MVSAPTYNDTLRDNAIEAMQRAAETIEIMVCDERRSVVSNPYTAAKWATVEKDAHALRAFAQSACVHSDVHYTPADDADDCRAYCSLCRKVWPNGKGRDDV